MKLLTKTNLNFLSISLFVFLIGVIVFYYLLRQQVDQNVNLDLIKRKAIIINQLESVHKSGKQPANQSEFIKINPIFGEVNISEGLSDTLLYVDSKETYIPYRQLRFKAAFDKQYYDVQIFRSLEETDLLIVRIFLIMTFVVIVIIISLLLMNRFITLQAWKVFYDTIDKIKNYDVNQHNEFLLKKAEVKEFKELNNVLTLMTGRIRSDYQNLKEYTENASHEIQTPLAIINSKMELLMQSGELNEREYNAVVDAYNASSRLSRLNKTLILLAKIENRQFPDSKEVIINDILNTHLETFEDLILNKELNLELDVKETVKAIMNPFLADILILNLLKNSIRHNIEKGQIHIDLRNNQLIFSNTGVKPKEDPEKFFQRFHKSSNSSESTGLGLAIVYKICELYNFEINYIYENDRHIITVQL